LTVLSGRLNAWAQLVRLPNVFTVLADVSAAFLLASGSAQPVGRLVFVLLAGVCLYWAGMILNDVADVELDREQRPGRPLPSGDISLGAAWTAGQILLGAGVLLAAIAGLMPAAGEPPTYGPALIAIALAFAIVAYNGMLKRTPLAPAVMGLCRFFSFLLGASAVAFSMPPGPIFPAYIVVAAAGFGIYVMGITRMARQEALVSDRAPLAVGLMVAMLGLGTMAYSPLVAPADVRFHVDPGGPFVLLIGLLAFSVLLRGLRVLFDPTPERLQMMIRVALLSLIPLAAAFAMLGAGPGYGLAIFALVVPAILLAVRLRVT
jgi:4-hydroxybenzoate polyprenyltransferase